MRSTSQSRQSADLRSALLPSGGLASLLLLLLVHPVSKFVAVQLPALATGLVWNTSQLHTAGVLSVTVAGDFDGNGKVDGADFGTWQSNFPQSIGATHVQGDADGDGDVDGADFVAWQTHFANVGTPAASPVPEPSGFMLLIAAVAWLGVRSQTKQHASRQD